MPDILVLKTIWLVINTVNNFVLFQLNKCDQKLCFLDKICHVSIFNYLNKLWLISIKYKNIFKFIPISLDANFF